MAEHHGIDARRVADAAFGIGVKIAAADADGAYTHLDFAGSGWIDGLFRETEFARRNQFGYKQCGYLEPL
jgi:hypothetical protein